MSGRMRLVVGLLVLGALAVAPSLAAGADYSITWVNNMNNPTWIQNTNGTCQNMRVEFKTATGAVLTGTTFNGPLPVAQSFGTTITVSGAGCATMAFSAACTFKKATDGPYVTETTSITETGCKSGRAIFLNHTFGMWFSPN